MVRKLGGVVLALFIAGFATMMVAVAAPAPAGPAARPATTSVASYCVDAEESAFLGLINTYRQQNGLGSLQLSARAGAAAEHHSVDMATKNYFDHTLSGGVSWSQNMVDHGYTASTFKGENIAAGYETAAANFQAWKASPGHNANMLNANYKVIGVGRAYEQSSTYDWYWTTDFGGYVYSADSPPACSGAASGPPPAPTAPPSSTYRISRSVRTSGSNSSAYAYDSNTGTAWITDPAKRAPSYAYIYFDLGSVKAIGSVQWMWQTGGLADKWRIEVSSDATTWTTIANRGNQAPGNWTTQSIGASARYVRFYFMNPNGDPQLGSLAEIKIAP